MRGKKLDNKGATLLEFIISMALFAVIMVPLLTAFSGAQLLMIRSRENMELSSFIRQVKSDVYNAAKNSSNPGIIQLPLYMTGSLASITKSHGQSKAGLGIFMNGMKINYYQYDLHIFTNSTNTDSPYFFTAGRVTSRPAFTLNDNLLNSSGNLYRLRIDIKEMDLNDPSGNSFKNVESFYMLVP